MTTPQTATMLYRILWPVLRAHTMTGQACPPDTCRQTGQVLTGDHQDDRGCADLHVIDVRHSRTRQKIEYTCRVQTKGDLGSGTITTPPPPIKIQCRPHVPDARSMHSDRGQVRTVNSDGHSAASSTDYRLSLTFPIRHFAPSRRSTWRARVRNTIAPRAFYCDIHTRSGSHP